VIPNSKHFLYSKTNLALLAIAGMLFGFVAGAQAMLSISMMLLGLTGIWGVPLKRWQHQHWWLLGLPWILICALSWFWSENKTLWVTLLQIKLPFLLLPLAFSFLPAFSARQLRIFTLLLFAATFCGMGYSVAAYLKDAGGYLSEYKYARLIPAPADGDHIRFSMMVALSVCWGCWMWPNLSKKWMRTLLGIALLLSFFYLHLLAAKTGLLMLYLFFLAFVIYLLTQKKHRLKGLALLLIAVAGVGLAYYLMPTFRERIGYTVYSIWEFRQGQRSGDYSDIGRIISYDIWLRLIQDFPMMGVGMGDILSAMSMGYDRWYPHIPAVQRLIPHNELMAISLGAGVPAALFFVVWLLQPFTGNQKGRDAFFFLAAWLMLFAALQTDAMLEVQYGVFVFLFFLCWFWHTLVRPSLKSQNPE